MPRYKDPYAPIDLKQYAEKAPTPDEKRKKEEGDIWRFIGSIAPTAGAAIGTGIGAAVGGPVGAGIGGTIGGGAGSVLGAGASGYGDSLTQEKETEEQDRINRRNELMMVLSGLRR